MEKPRVGMVFVGMPLMKNGEGYFCKASIFNMLGHAPQFLDIELLCPVLRGGGEGYGVDVAGIVVHPLSGWTSGFDLYGRKFILIALQIFRLFRRLSERWDAVVIIDPDPMSHVAYFFARIMRKRCILYLRGDDTFEILGRNPEGGRGVLAGLWCRCIRFSIASMLRHCVGVVTGRALFERYRSLDPILYYASAVSEAQLAQRQEVEKPFRTGKAPLRLLMVGYLAAYKGYDIAIEAVGLLHKCEGSVHLDIIGTGPDECRLRALAGKAGVSAMVSFRGFVPYGRRLFDFYGKADVFLLMSRSEGTPKVVPEAFSFGLPVVASRVGGVPDMVKDRENGILLPLLTAEALSLALQRLIDSPETLGRLSEGAFRSARQYSVERQLKSAIHEAGRRFLCP